MSLRGFSTLAIFSPFSQTFRSTIAATIAVNDWDSLYSLSARVAVRVHRSLVLANARSASDPAAEQWSRAGKPSAAATEQRYGVKCERNAVTEQWALSDYRSRFCSMPADPEWDLDRPLPSPTRNHYHRESGDSPRRTRRHGERGGTEETRQDRGMDSAYSPEGTSGKEIK